VTSLEVRPSRAWSRGLEASKKSALLSRPAGRVLRSLFSCFSFLFNYWFREKKGKETNTRKGKARKQIGPQHARVWLAGSLYILMSFALGLPASRIREPWMLFLNLQISFPSPTRFNKSPKEKLLLRESRGEPWLGEGRPEGREGNRVRLRKRWKFIMKPELQKRGAGEVPAR